MDPLRIYDYLTKTRDRVFDAVRTLTPQQYNRASAIGLKTIGSTLTHIMVSEWYYIERLQEHDVPHYDTWPIKYESPPAFDVIERSWREQAKHVRAVIKAQSSEFDNRQSTIVNRQSPQGWARPITWLSFPDDTRGNKRYHITCTAGDLFTQLALHEVHHRAQIMAMLRESGAAILEDLDFNALMYQRVEAT